MPETPLDRSAIEHHLQALGDRLAVLEITARLTVVGGSYMALVGLRDSTMDVDTITRLDDTLRRAVADVAEEFDLEPTWLNDRALSFQPHIELSIGSVLFEHPNLVVDGPTADFMFLMKLDRGEQRDRSDLIALWPSTTFGTPQAAAVAHEAAYPHIPRDEYLATYIANIARAAASG